MKKKVCSLLLAGALLTSALPPAALAADEGVTENAGAALSAVWDGVTIETDWYSDDETAFTLSTAAQLAGLAQLVNDGTSFAGKTVQLGADIDLGGKEWTPIGKSGAAFQGSFDGDGHTISHLKIDAPEKAFVGLFGSCGSPAKLQKLTLHDVDVTGANQTAAVLGGSNASSSTIADVHVTGSIRITGKWFVGGLMGQGYGTVQNCSIEGDGTATSFVTASGGYAGGIVGFMGEGNNITSDCTVKDIAVSGAYNGIGGVNGILHYGNTIEGCTLENVEVWQFTDPSEDAGRIFAGAFAGTYHDNGGSNIPTVKSSSFVGGIYSGRQKQDITSQNYCVGELWYGLQSAAPANIQNCSVEAKEQVTAVQGVSLNQMSLTLVPGETAQLTATVMPADATQQSLTWQTTDAAVATVENGLVTAVGTGTATITVKVNDEGSDYGFASQSCEVTVEEKQPSGGGSTAGGGSSSGSSSSGNKTETTTHPDGSTTTTVTKPDGSTTETTKKPDGTQQVVETGKDGATTTTTTDTDGNKTAVTENTDGSTQTTVTQTNGASSTTTVDGSGRVETTVTLPAAVVDDAAGKGETVALPMPGVSAAADKAAAPSVTVSLSGGASAKVEVPVENVTPGTVAVLIQPDGTEQIIKNTVATENGVALTVGDGATIKIVDNTKTFDDVTDAHWGSDAVTFASSRELFTGTGSKIFAPEGNMTRAMVVTVLARYEGVDTAAGANWYDAGRDWAVENGISDGGNLDASVTREQLAAMLYRYVGSPAVTGAVEGFADADRISGWASDAMRWATQTGLLSGKGGGRLDPTGTATRAEVAQILMNFCTRIA